MNDLSVPYSSGAMVVTGELRGSARDDQNFQSPIHRGNGCNVINKLNLYELINFQSPIHRGNGCNP